MKENKYGMKLENGKSYSTVVTLTTHPEYYDVMNLGLDADGDSVRINVDEDSVRIHRDLLHKPNGKLQRFGGIVDMKIGDKIAGKLTYITPDKAEAFYMYFAKKLNLNMDGDMVLCEFGTYKHRKVYCGWKEPNKLTNWIKLQLFRLKFYLKRYLKF